MPQSTALNSCRISYRFKKASSTDYSDSWTPLEGTEVDVVISETFDVRSTYTFQLKVEDDVGEQKIYTYLIPFVSTPLNPGRGGRNLGLGQFCDYSEPDRIDVGWKTYFNTGIGRKVIFKADNGQDGWGTGKFLSEVIADADPTMVLNYNIFIAIVKQPPLTAERPVLCIRHNNNIYSSCFGNFYMEINYSSEQKDVKIVSMTNAYVVTELYALL